MSSNSKSFWSTMPGLITGIAGILTALVGLATILIQIGVIGGDGDSGPGNEPGETVTTDADGRPSGGSGGSGTATTAGRPTFTVAPTSLRLSGSEKSDTVTVTNTGSAAFSVSTAVTGAGDDQFEVSKGSCGSEVPGRGSCTMTVSFKGGLEATAKLVVTVRGAASPQEVSLRGTLL